MADQTMIRLPEEFQKKMKDLLGEEYDAFVQSYENERVQGLRFNTLKTDIKETLSQVPEEFELQKNSMGKRGILLWRAVQTWKTSLS